MARFPRGSKLHIGCGDKRLEGWVNIDFQALPGVDVVADVTKGLDFEDVAAIYAEHFLEHLAIDDALSFLAESHEILARDGAIRLSTPNLDWVWHTHYRLDGESREKAQMAINLNRAFHGWEHQFLWNREMLTTALEACGFTGLTWHVYGESGRPVFQGLERHETYGDVPELRHVLIVEAARGKARRSELKDLREWIQRDFLNHMKG